MASVVQGLSKTINLGPTDAVEVRSSGEGYVDHVSGTPGSPYESARIVDTTTPKKFGPYGVSAVLRLRAVSSTLRYYPVRNAQPASVEIDENGITKLSTAALPLAIRNLFRRSTVAHRTFFGRCEAVINNVTPQSYRVLVELASDDIEEIAPIIVNASNTPFRVESFNVHAVPAFTMTGLSNPVAGVVGAGDNVPAGAAPSGAATQRRGVYIPAMVKIPSVKRADGVKSALYVITVYVSTAANITGMGGTNDVLTTWASRSRGRRFVLRQNAGDCVATPANFTDTTNRNSSPIWGVRYKARGRVITLGVDGDSIYDGRGSIHGEGFGVIAAETAQEITGIPTEFCNLAWSGKGYTDISLYIADAVAAGIIPDVLLFPNASPNSFPTSGGITSAHINAAKTLSANILATCYGNDIMPAIIGVLPTNTAVKNYGTSDSLRRDLNDDTFAGFKGVDKFDFASEVSGGVDSSGQEQMSTESQTDGIHPDDRANIPFGRKVGRWLAGFQ